MQSGLGHRRPVRWTISVASGAWRILPVRDQAAGKVGAVAPAHPQLGAAGQGFSRPRAQKHGVSGTGRRQAAGERQEILDRPARWRWMAPGAASFERQV